MTDDDPLDDRDKEGDNHVDPDVPSGNEGNADGGRVFTPEELDISDSNNVEQLDNDGRYVVSAGDDPPKAPNDSESSPSGGRKQPTEGRTPPADAPHGQSGTAGPDSDVPRSPEAARSLLADELRRTNARYGLDIVARLEGETVRHRTVSNDVVATFESLVQWYAQHITEDTPTEDVIEILFRESSLGQAPTTPTLAKLLETHDLEETDSIAELVEAIGSELDGEL
jgi:hypothetical protein